MKFPESIRKPTETFVKSKYNSTIEKISSGEDMKFHLISGTSWPRMHYSKLRKDIKEAFPGTSTNSIHSYTHFLPSQVKNRVDELLVELQNSSVSQQIIVAHSFGGMIAQEALNRISENIGDVDISLFTLGTPHNTLEIPTAKENLIGRIIKPSIQNQIRIFEYKDTIPKQLKATFSITNDRIVPPILSRIKKVAHTEIPTPIEHFLGSHFGYFTTECIRHEVVKEIGKHIL